MCIYLTTTTGEFAGDGREWGRREERIIKQRFGWEGSETRTAKTMKRNGDDSKHQRKRKEKEYTFPASPSQPRRKYGRPALCRKPSTDPQNTDGPKSWQAEHEMTILTCHLASVLFLLFPRWCDRPSHSSPSIRVLLLLLRWLQDLSATRE